MIAYCSNCRKIVGFGLVAQEIPILCVKCAKNYEGIYDKLVAEIQAKNDQMVKEGQAYLDKMEYDAEKQSVKDFYEALGVDDPDGEG
jgi:hypothetical protein